MHGFRPFSVPIKVLQNSFLAWCEVGVCRVLRPATGIGPSHEGIGRVDSTRVSQLKLRGKALERARNGQPHDTKHDRDMQSCKRRELVLSPTVMEYKELWWTMSPKGSREVQHTNKHATTLRSRKQMKKKHPDAFAQCILCVQLLHAGGLQSASVQAM
jgi:hypothetical protein